MIFLSIFYPFDIVQLIRAEDWIRNVWSEGRTTPAGTAQ